MVTEVVLQSGWWSMCLVGAAVAVAARPQKAHPDLPDAEALQRLLQLSSDVLVALNDDGTCAHVCGATKALLGVEQKRLRGTRLADLVHTGDRRDLQAFLRDCSRNPRVRRSIERRLPGDSSRWCQIETYNNRRTDPAFSGLILRIRDITDRKNAEVALEQHSATLRTITEASPLAIVVEDLAGIVRMWNPAAERLFGWSAADVVGATSRTVPEDRLDDHRHLRDRVLHGEVMSALEAQRWRKDGSLLDVSISTAPLLDAQGRPCAILEMVSDITEHKQLEAQLRHAQKMEGIGRLAGGIAHDFNNLLTAILGHADMLLQDLPNEQTGQGPDAANSINWPLIRSDVQDIKRAGERASALTQGLLAFSRNQVLQMTVLDLNDVVTSMQTMLKRIIGEHIDFQVFCAPNLARVKADPSQIEQVIMNLVLNARDAMPEGGKLTVETANVELDEGYSRRRMPVVPGSYVQVAVSDTGCGMDQDVQHRIFDPFFTTKERGKGTGLGLSTVYGIVKQSGGYIWVYSERNHGTTFKVYLPTEQTRVAGTRPEGQGSKVVVTGVETILVVEDEEMVRALVRQVLTRHGYRVLEACAGQEALQILDSRSDIDLMLTDIIMPGMSVADLIRQVAARRPDLRIMYMSGYTDHGGVRNGLLDSRVPFMQKPFAPERLAHKVRQILDDPHTVRAARLPGQTCSRARRGRQPQAVAVRRARRRGRVTS